MRTQELGVRMALGADSRRILGMVLRQGSAVTGVGVVLGVLITLALAVAVGDGMQTVLFGVSPRDPLVYSAVVVLVAIISLAASFVPARRATRVDPRSRCVPNRGHDAVRAVRPHPTTAAAPTGAPGQSR